MKAEYLVIAAAVIIAALLIWKRKQVLAFLQKESVQKEIKHYIIWAEETYIGEGRGAEKMDRVCERLWGFLPGKIRTFVTKDDLKAVIEFIFEQMKVRIDGHNVPIDK